MLILGLASWMLFLVSLWDNRQKRELGQAKGDVAHQDPRCAGAQGVFASLRERPAEGFSELAGRWLRCVLDKLSCRKKNEVDINLFLPLKTLFMVPEDCPALQSFTPGLAAWWWVM